MLSVASNFKFLKGEEKEEEQGGLFKDLFVV
jgi:hypothetical protein